MSEKHVLVTGASRGIGKAIALAFADRGYDVAVTCLERKEMLLHTRKEIESRGVRALSWIGDAGDYQSCRELFLQIKKEFGGLDILVNNAGISYIGLLQDMSPADWQRVMHTNLDSVFNTSKLAIPLMLEKHAGKIINISSVWGSRGASCEVAYSASKGAVNAFTRSLARELAPSGIQVNAIACGVIDTEMNHFLSDEELLALTEEIPAGRMGLAEEVAVFCTRIAEANDYLTGQVISLDGGWMV